MPNIKSAKKRVLVNAKKTEQNKNIRSEVKTEIKKIYALIKEGKIEEAKALLPNAFKLIDSAAGKNIFHKNNAANKKSKLAKKIEAAAKDVPFSQKEEVKAEEPAPAAVETVAEEVAEEPVKKTRKPRAKKTEETEAAE
ncbi:MAG: 30S ribosomal protein S20 [Clostridia bacterium]|nr:30S ribosomal protein S20 [Clostridia bacterium]